MSIWAPYLFVCFALLLLVIVAHWEVFAKAGRPGCVIFIPFYNLYVCMQISSKPGWWWVLLCIPGVNIIFSILMMRGLARNFGKGVGFTVGLLLVPIVFWSILAFGNARYSATPA
ncbi:MAG: signal peptidase I [Phycisphaerales bacterium]|nr:signal peptidase I [Phycisphaerales bacterium]